MIPSRIPPINVRNRTDTAKYCCHECLDTRHGTGVRRQGRVRRAEQHACYCRQGGTNRKGYGDRAVYIDTHQGCRTAILRNRQSIACPIFVLLINVIRAAIITIQLKIVTIVYLEIASLPPASFDAGTVITDVNCLALEPKIRSATFWSR